MRTHISTISRGRVEADNSKRQKILKLFLLTILATAALWTAGPRFTPVRGQDQAPQAKIRKHANAISNRYIVVLRDEAVNGFAREESVAELGNSLAASYSARIEQTYKHALNGYVMEMSEAEAQALSQDARVASVEEDCQIHVEGNAAEDFTQDNATWGLDRINQRSLPLDNRYSYDTTGKGVNVYVIDTGIRRTHQEFQGRAVTAFDAVNDGKNGDDCTGHGTLVAGIIGGATYGVAKNARLYSVRVFDCKDDSKLSWIIAAVDWVTANHVKPAVANMSINGPQSYAFDKAVENSFDAGVTYTVSAGNDNRNACLNSPAGAFGAITVGATTKADVRAAYSNYGYCVRIFAPGSGITSAWLTSDDATNTLNGTSLAAPHVAGAAALYLEAHPDAQPPAVTKAILESATTGRVSDAREFSPNLLLHSQFGVRSSGAVATVSAANFSNAVAYESIAAVFGANLAPGAQAAPAEGLLPTELAGTGVTVTDSSGARRSARLFFVSPGQINFEIPSGLYYIPQATGVANVPVRVTRGDDTVFVGTAQLARVSPGLFTANGNGQGVPAAVIARAKANGNLSYEPVAQYDATQGRFVPRPIDLGATTETASLVLFGTGVRGHSGISTVSARIGGMDVPVQYAGKQAGLVGLDQINLILPRGLMGRGEVDLALVVDGKPANTVKLNIK